MASSCGSPLSKLVSLPLNSGCKKPKIIHLSSIKDPNINGNISVIKTFYFMLPVIEIFIIDVIYINIFTETWILQTVGP